ncbi:MAG TPA: phosphate ABC transporter substrate-binding protein [Anaerolineae bacterium]|nr:phosphate ABC transporter substrate-binding protein [Anaerolineae bacterium]
MVARAWLETGGERLGFSLSLFIFIAVLLLGCSPATTSADAPADTPIETIENKGSDTMVNLALAWAETYMAQNPQVRISVTGGGSGTGIAALINGTVDMANASRAIKPEEVDEARSKGVEPFEIAVAQDAIAVVVNPANPVDQLTMQQISDIYTGQITNWQEVGGEDRPIVLLSRESNSGTYVFFLEEVVRQGDADSNLLFSPDTLLLPSSEGISAEIRQNPNAIGYDGLGYVTPDQKTLAIALSPTGPGVKPSLATVVDGSYPISRPLFMYTPGRPTGATKTYLDWIMTAGQQQVKELGFVPLAATN